MTWACTTTVVNQVQPGDDAGDDGASSVGTEKPDASDAAAPDAHVPQVARCTSTLGADAGPPPSFDAGSTFFTVHPQAQLLNVGGPVLASPKIVPIFFAGDPLATTLDDFVASFGCTSHWRAAVAEYGVGDAIALPAVHLTEKAPTTITDADLESWLIDKLTASGKPLGTVQQDAVYVIFYPETTTITQGGAQSCQSFGGYHTDVTLPSGDHVAYAAIPRCNDFAGLPMIDSTTGATSHEIMEAATDPYNKESPAFGYLDPQHAAMMFLLGAECGDLCAQEPDAFYKPSGYPWTVQRNWSNRAAAAGMNPCLPKAARPYFTAAPKLVDAVDLFDGESTTGVRVPVGTSKTIDVDLYDESASELLDVQVMDATAAIGASGSSTYSLDKSSGKSGETLRLTITTPAGAPPDTEIFMIYVSAGSDYRVAGVGTVGH